jgi:hypothetical protein
MPYRVPTALELSGAERAELEGWARRRKTAHALALRARIVLRAAAAASRLNASGNVRRFLPLSTIDTSQALQLIRGVRSSDAGPIERRTPTGRRGAGSGRCSGSSRRIRHSASCHPTP